MQKLMNRKNKKGFTLIELIIVIAIIAILAAILVPSMLGYINDANQATANANARTVYSAASAAAASQLAANQKATSIAEKDTGTLNKTKGTFEGDLQALLGDGFSGFIAVTVNADGVVTGTTWKQDAAATITGTYATP